MDLKIIGWFVTCQNVVTQHKASYIVGCVVINFLNSNLKFPFGRSRIMSLSQHTIMTVCFAVRTTPTMLTTKGRWQRQRHGCHSLSYTLEKKKIEQTEFFRDPHCASMSRCPQGLQQISYFSYVSDLFSTYTDEMYKRYNVHL